MIQKSDLVLVRKVNLRMKDRDQRCEAVRVVGGNTGSWKGFYWPQDVRVLDQEVREMLQRLNLVEYEEVFKKQELSLIDIAEMNHVDLQSIGISLVKHRRAIIEYLSGKLKHDMELFPSAVQFMKIFQLRAPHQRSHRLEEGRGQREVQLGLSRPSLNILELKVKFYVLKLFPLNHFLFSQ